MYGHFHRYPFQVIGDPFYCNVFGEEGEGVGSDRVERRRRARLYAELRGGGLACEACRRFPLVSLLR